MENDINSRSKAKVEVTQHEHRPKTSSRVPEQRQQMISASGGDIFQYLYKRHEHKKQNIRRLQNQIEQN